ncbi:MAG: hypothetical protein HC884_14095 [Chloroflexaceae bacterium]|nr:hypothetical protein [Chloroflexaceae bacterium]
MTTRTPPSGTKSFWEHLTNLPGELLAGAIYPLRAIGVLVRYPGLVSYILLPLLLNLLIGSVLYAGLLTVGLREIDALVDRVPEWAGFFEAVLFGLLAIILLLVIGFVLLRFGMILGAPWYGRLSERLEQIHTGHQPTPAAVTWKTIIHDCWYAIMFEMKKFLLFVGVGLLLLLLNLVPVAGSLLSTIGWLLLAATIVCLDFFDPPLSRRYVRFRTRLSLILHALPASATFGLTWLSLVSIPFVGLVAIPMGVIAGTLFFLDRIRGQGAW